MPNRCDSSLAHCCLYIVSALSGASIARCSMAVIPIVVMMVAVLMLITYVPELVLVVPHHFGY
jgi:TRAP-type C4-dicarboxylate transport system permease large subunit